MAAKYCIASFHADSTASPPPLVKKTRFRSPGARPARRAARRIAGSVPKLHSGKYGNVRVWCSAAVASSCLPWPMLTVNRPLSPSR